MIMNRKGFLATLFGGAAVAIGLDKAKASEPLSTGSKLNVSGSLVGSGQLSIDVRPLEGQITYWTDPATKRTSVWCYSKDWQGELKWQRLKFYEHEELDKA